MKILYIATHCPYGRSYGAQMRTLQIGKILQRFGNVKLLIASYGDYDKKSLEQTNDNFDVGLITKLVPSPFNGYSDRFNHDFNSKWMNTSGHVVSEEAMNVFSNLEADSDLVWVHTLTVANFFRKWHWSNSVIDVDDLLSSYFFGDIAKSDGVYNKLNSLRKYNIWKRREKHILDRFSVATVCSEKDKRFLGGGANVHVVPNGFPDYEIQHHVKKNRLGVVGKMDYAPNRDGVVWFLKNVWPKILSSCPHAEFRIVGSGCPEEWRQYTGVCVVGYLDDTAEEIGSWVGTVVPILVGGGTRVKIAEAFSRGCAVVSTRLGAFGYNVTHARELLLADRPDDFASACIELLENKELMESLVSRARSYYDNNLNYDSIAVPVQAAINAAIACKNK